MKAYAAVADTGTAELLARARTGEREAFTELVERHHAELVRISYAITGDLDMARDAAQLAWIKAWQRLPSVREPDRLRAWLVAIASNEARQHVRASSRRRVPEITPLDPDGVATKRDIPSADQLDLTDSLARLDPADRELQAMRYLAGLTAEEIGAATGVTASGVRSRMPPLGEVYQLPAVDELIAAELELNPTERVLAQGSRDGVEGEADRQTYEVVATGAGRGMLFVDCQGPAEVRVTLEGEEIVNPCLTPGSYQVALNLQTGDVVEVDATGDTTWRVAFYGCENCSVPKESSSGPRLGGEDRRMAIATRAREVRAPRGSEISCRGWQQEAVLRMLMNNLDPEVAERPEDLVVYGGTGRAARSWEAYDAIVRELRRLGDDETLLVQSGKPVGVFRTHEWAPRVLIANSNLVGKWANWDTFRELERQGLTMYGQMTAGSWIYIGTQGILQGTYETFAELARQHFGGTLRGRVVLTAGLGGMGGAQPLAVTMNEGVALVIEVDPHRARRRLEIGYVDRLTDSLDEALGWARSAAAEGRGESIALIGNAAEIEPELGRRGERFDVLTDQTSAHDALNGYVPAGLTLDQAADLRRGDPTAYVAQAMASMATQVRAMLALRATGAVTFDYGNNIRAQAQSAGVENAFDFPGFVPAFIRPLFCEGKGPFRWVALSGDPADIRRTDEAILELFPEDESLARWIRMAQEKVPFQGLPARICWLGYGERARAGLRFNELVAAGEVSAPIVIGRDHLDSGSVASPNRETEAMRDGSDAIADWPLLNALVNTSAGASWVSIHHGGGTGIGYSQHAGMVVVADGSELAAQKLERVLTTDPGMGVIRHADAGYERAIEVARERRVRIPMNEG